MVTMPVPKGFYITSGFGPRAGGYHWGTDYGVKGGSGGKPVYAVKDGTVTRAGAASGFGRWVTIDHPANNGGGETVYGHIIPEVRAGQRVTEGQRIARIDPDSSTNGGVAPHLHLEWHRYSWVPPGPDRLNPEHMLRGAKWVGDTAPAPAPGPKGGEIFGVDVSEHQDGMSLKRARDEGISFAILRLCDGTYRDRTFRSHLEDAESAGLLVSTYWYLRAPSEGTTISQQVDVIDQQMGGRRDLSVWIDVESVDGAGRKLLTGQDVWAAKRELEKRGYTVAGIYSGAWYWEHMPGGEPAMQGLGNLWVSHYGTRNAYGNYRSIYDNEGGGKHPGWSYPLGDKMPDILQYGSNGFVAGKYVDVNAFRGSRDELARIFHSNNANEEELTVADVERIITHINRTTDEIKRYIDVRVTEPIGSDVKDVRQQLTGGRDKVVREDGTVDLPASYPGWEQLGKNSDGQNLTVTDAIAALRQDFAELGRLVINARKETR